MTRPMLRTTAAFAPATLDKVGRLLEVLDTFHGDPVLGPAFVLHGGTALNVFLDALPRLSADIDVMHVGSADADGMRRARPLVDARLREITAQLGYSARATNDEHSGQTYRLQYGAEYLKIDVSYLARVTLLPARSMTCDLADPPVSFAVLDPLELAAGKVKALMESRRPRPVRPRAPGSALAVPSRGPSGASAGRASDLLIGSLSSASGSRRGAGRLRRSSRERR